MGENESISLIHCDTEYRGFYIRSYTIGSRDFLQLRSITDARVYSFPVDELTRIIHHEK